MAPLASARAFRARSFVPDSVVIASSEYPAHGDPQVQLGQNLPSGSPAVAGGEYPEVFNNDVSADTSFAVNTPIELTDVNPFGDEINRTRVPTDQMTTSFSSKSELAINFSSNGQDLSFLGYNAAPDALDASNSNTPGVIDPTNPDPEGPYYRVAASLDPRGQWTFTDSNAYSGDNGRAVMLDNENGLFYAAGNSNNGTGTAAPVVDSGGAQVFAPSDRPQSEQNSGAPTQLGFFSITEVPPNTKADKAGKDTNFRGLTVHDGVVYVTKGSGSNGINSVYYVDTTSSQCPSDGQGLPVPGQPLPSIADSTSYPLCILKGFNTTTAKKTTDVFPFGIWFANPTTLYVADEGAGNPSSGSPYAGAASDTMGGLQKWTFNATTQSWQYDYTLQSGLNLGQPYTVPGYPSGDNSYTGEPWAPATDGLRNISGQVNCDGTATIYAATSTVSGGGDPGADPNEVVKITDELAATTPGGESFTTVARPKNRVVYRGVAVVPADHGAGS